MQTMRWEDYTKRGCYWKRYGKVGVPSATSGRCREQLCAVPAWKIYLEDEYKNIPAAVQYLTLAADQKINLRHTGWADFILWEKTYRRI